MGTTDPIHERRTAGAGCPKVLTTDLSRNDVLDPVVEWPPAPPTRSAPTNGGTAPKRAAGSGGRVAHQVRGRDDATVSQLATGRATQLLEASIDHLRTVLEMSPDEQTSARVERAIGEISDVCKRLHALTTALS